MKISSSSERPTTSGSSSSSCLVKAGHDVAGSRNASGSWFRRWGLALVLAVGSAACAVILVIQSMEISDLETNIRVLSDSAETQRQQPTATLPTADSTAKSPDDASADSELAGLRKLAEVLGADVAGLEQMKAENDKLRSQLASRISAAFPPDDLKAMEDAMDRATTIACVNNMKQIGLAARVWALDNADIYPTNFLCMSNELSTPKILVCPADTNRVVAANFSTYSDANSSYEFFIASETEPSQVLCRCPLHGSIGLADGSVHSGVAKSHPDWLVQRDGKLYMEPPAQPATPTTSASPSP